MTRIDFIPGTMCDERLWSQVVRFLDADFDCNFIPLHKARTRDELLETIDGHSGRPATLVAFSMGAYLAIEHTLAHPDRVRSLVLIASSAKGLSEAESLRRRRVMEWLAHNRYAGISAADIARYVHESHLKEERIVQVIRDMDRALGKEVLLAQLAASTERRSLMDRFAEIRCPVLVAGSIDDRMVKHADLEEMHAAIPGSRLRLYSGVGHMIPLEGPEMLARDIGLFLGAIA
jgi:pimeloyl-ACP methyl ester carboxylesterase